MRKFVVSLVLVALLLGGALALGARAAGDASAIRRATRPEDSRWVTNYRPGSNSTSYRYRANNYSRTTAARSSNVRTTAPVGCRGR